MNGPLGHPVPWPAPGKLNLFLHIVGRRPDGYHELQTVFQFVDLWDSLHFAARPAGVIERLNESPHVPRETDLVLRAARLLAERARGRADSAPGVAIAVEKRLPIGGGVGGGSSDAATTLVALNELWHLDLPMDQLAALGLELGADVPVFIGGQAAWAEGIGDRLAPVEPPEPVYLLVCPDVTVSTAEIFKAPELTRDSPLTTITGFLQYGGRNDCEPVVRRRYPKVAAALDWLGHFGSARMTGTGSCVFVPMPDVGAAEAVLEQAPREWGAWVTRGLNRSPLLERLGFERRQGGQDVHASSTASR